ncbi:MAG TPA: hypothetical protein VI685_17395 [Candidatus Angelobacter sp.]
MIVLRALYLAIRVVLALAFALWVLILVELLPVLFTTGMGGVRSKLMYIWSLGKFDLPWTCQDSLQLIHEGYTDLLVFVLLTWGLLELKRFLALNLSRPTVNWSRPEGGNTTPSTHSESGGL